VLKRVKYSDDDYGSRGSCNSDYDSNTAICKRSDVGANNNDDNHSVYDSCITTNNNNMNMNNGNDHVNNHHSSSHNNYISNKHNKPRVVSTQVLLNAIRNIACGLPNAASFRMALNDVYIRCIADQMHRR